MVVEEESESVGSALESYQSDTFWREEEEEIGECNEVVVDRGFTTCPLLHYRKGASSKRYEKNSP